MSEYIGKTCPYCKGQIGANDEVTVCTACGIPHHKGCWEENKGCTTFGCSEQHYAPTGTNITDACAACGAPLGDGQEFCPKCGQKAGLAVDSGVAARINQANAAVVTQKKKKRAFPIVAVVVVALVAIVGYFVNAQMQAKNLANAIDVYIAAAKSFQSDVLSAASTLEKIGNAEQTNWHTYIYDNGKYYYKTFDSIEDAVYSAQVSESTNVSTAKLTKPMIEKSYQALIKVPKGAEDDLAEIKSAVRELYDMYTDMYTCVMDVTGNYTSWTSDFSDVDSGLMKKYNALKNALASY